jgi:SAM-dependent methyltransferase
VIALGLLEHSENPDRVLAEVGRVLRLGGTLYCSGSSVFSAVFVARKIRELLGKWPYGYQRNRSPRGLVRLVARRFEVERIEVAQTDFDFPVEAFVDRLMTRLDRSWGRYVIVRARKDPLKWLSSF